MQKTSRAKTILPALFLLGATAGVLAETLMLLSAHSKAVETWLSEDMRVVAFLKDGIGSARESVVLEKIRAIAGVARARAVSSEESLREFTAGDGDLAQSVAFLGENPLPNAVEFRLGDAGLQRFQDVLREARSVDDVADVRAKPLEARVLLQVQFYRRWLSLTLACAFGFWALAFALGLWRRLLGPLGEDPWGGLRAAGASGMGAAAGLLAAAALFHPIQRHGYVPQWPPPAAQAALVLAGAAAGWILAGARGPGAAARGILAAALAASAARAAEGPPNPGELKRIREQIERKREEARTFQRQAQKAREDISNILGEKNRIRRRLRAIEGRTQEVRSRQAELTERLGAIQSAAGRGRLLLAGEIRSCAAAMAGSEPFFASADVWRMAFRRAAIDGRMRYLGGLRRAEGRTSEEHQGAREQARSLRRKTEQAEVEISRGEGLVREKRQTLQESSRKAEQAAGALRELEETARAMESFLADAERRRRGSPSASGPVAKHSLPWPVDGRVVGRFGKARVPGLDAWVLHNGIKIAAAPGSAVRAVAGGRVLFSGPYRSYGNVAIIDHDAAFFGIYGQLGSIVRAKGERVSPGMVLGSAGDAGEEPVYFEIRRGFSRPVDPLDLLEER